MIYSEAFKKDNRTSLGIANKVEKVLKYKGLASLVPIINSCSISLKLSNQFKQLNSTLSVDQRGFGKSTLLKHILSKSNPKFFQVLPMKCFESQLVEKPKEYFHNKILVHDDLITSFSGSSTKQRQQLTNFFTLLLSDGSYDREKHKLEGITCLAHFGLAWESYKQNRKQLFDSTFLDRFSLYKVPLDNTKKNEILKMRDLMKGSNQELPKIKLPLKKSKTKVLLNLTPEMMVERNKLAMQLDSYNIMSAFRAQNYIDLFMMSNAYLNDRNKVTLSDLQMYKQLHPFHLNSSIERSKKQRIRSLIIQNKGITVKEIVQKTGYPRSTVYRIVEEVKNKK
jgi:hypothetical protein